MTIYQKLLTMQQKIRVTKDQYNSFGKYSYRSALDIYEACKPIMKELNVVMYFDDGIEFNGNDAYVRTVLHLVDAETGENVYIASVAKHPVDTKGQSAQQETGSTLSYAHKYALEQLLLLDNNKDPDSNEYHEQTKKPAAERPGTKPFDKVQLPNGRWVAKEYYDACNYEEAGGKLGWWYKNDRAQFDDFAENGNDAVKKQCEIIKKYKEEYAK